MGTSSFHSIAVVGSGALGLYYGARLAGIHGGTESAGYPGSPGTPLPGLDVRFLMRGDLSAVQARGSILIHDKHGTHEQRPVRAFAAAEDIGPVDLVLVTLKTTANRELDRILPPLLGPNTAVLTLQNGLGADEYIAGVVGAERVLGGLAFIASTRTGPGEVTCYHPGSITLGEFRGPPTPRVHAVADLFARAGVKIKAIENLLEARWRKLVWNVPFNGLAVVHNQTTDTLCADPAIAEEIRALMKEVQAGAAAFGFAIPDSFLEQQFSVTPPMGPYQPSSLVDARSGREVEVEAIWGEPLRRAKAQGVAVPRLEALYRRLRS